MGISRWKPGPEGIHLNSGEGKRHQTESQVPPVTLACITGAGQVEAQVSGGHGACDESREQQEPQAGGRNHGGPDLGKLQGEDRHQQHAGDQRQQHQPIEKHIPRDRCDQRPRVARKEPEFRSEIVAVLPEVADRFGFRVEARSLALRQLTDYLAESVGRSPLETCRPGGEPASQVAAARDRGEKIEFAKEFRPGARGGRRRPAGQSLQHSQSEGRAANSASGEAQG